MKAQLAVLPLACAAAFVAGAQKMDLSRVSTPRIVEGRVIVELKNPSALSTQREDLHARFFDELDRRAPGSWRTRKVYSSDVFNGATLDLHSGLDLVSLASVEGVRKVTPVHYYDSPEVFDHIRSPPTAYASPAELYPPHVMTGVDKAHAMGVLGQGVKIGILDTGIDYTHEVFGPGFGPGHKVAGGYDLVGDDFSFANGFTPHPDDDPLDQCEGHGTHVAGIIGANPGNPYNISGVAYESELYSYRIFGCAGGTTDDVIIDGLIMAYEAGMDVITLSLGGGRGWSEAAPSVVASRIANKGRVVTIAAGNSGTVGMFYGAMPASGLDVISVGSVNNVLGAVYSAAIPNVEHAPIPYLPTSTSVLPLPVGSGAYAVYATSNITTEDDACTALPDNTPDLSALAVLVRRARRCTPAIQIANIAAKGGKVVLVYNDAREFATIDFKSESAALIRADDGAWLLSQVVAGANIALTFPQDPKDATVKFPDNAAGGLVSSFSSYGPSYEMHFKPSLSAPGGHILSAYPVPLGEYVVQSGTSMATPYLAGVAALVLQSRGKTPEVAKSMRTLLETTSATIPSDVSPDAFPQTFAQGGAGLVSAANALTYQTLVSPGELLLNDTAHWKSVHVIKVRNTSKRVRTYMVSHVPALTALSRQPSPSISFNGIPAVPQTANISVHVNIALTRLVVLPGSTASVPVTIQPPRDFDPWQLPVVSGHIVISTTDGDAETLKVSYLGALASLRDIQVIDNTTGVLAVPTPILVDATGSAQLEPTNYTFIGSDVPSLLVRFAFGTNLVNIDLVDADADIPTNIEVPLTRKRGFFSSWWPGLFQPKGTYAKIPIVGTLVSETAIQRSDNPLGFATFLAMPNRFANGTAIPLGNYRLLIRALRVLGDATDEDDYDVWLSLPIGVVAA